MANELQQTIKWQFDEDPQAICTNINIINATALYLHMCDVMGLLTPFILR